MEIYISEPVNIQIGTRQGGLTSCYLFNLFYTGMMEELDKTVGEIRIGGAKFNAFGYADDALLTSVTATGLQALTLLSLFATIVDLLLDR